MRNRKPSSLATLLALSYNHRLAVELANGLIFHIYTNFLPTDPR